MRALIERLTTRREQESDEAYDRRIRSQYVDSCRFLLPAASLANLGMTANARVLEHAIGKMLSHPLAEVRQIGAEVKRVSQAEVPTLVKYAETILIWSTPAWLFQLPAQRKRKNRMGAKKMPRIGAG